MCADKGCGRPTQIPELAAGWSIRRVQNRLLRLRPHGFRFSMQGMAAEELIRLSGAV